MLAAEGSYGWWLEFEGDENFQTSVTVVTSDEADAVVRKMSELVREGHPDWRKGHSCHSQEPQTDKFPASPEAGVLASSSACGPLDSEVATISM